MELSIPETAIVFRRVHEDGRKGPWHILKMWRSGGFTPKSHPDRPLWWDFKTYIGLCNKREESGITSYGHWFDGHLELSVLGKIKKVCPTCWPYGKVEINKSQLEGE